MPAVIHLIVLSKEAVGHCFVLRGYCAVLYEQQICSLQLVDGGNRFLLNIAFSQKYAVSHPTCPVIFIVTNVRTSNLMQSVCLFLLDKETGS